MTGTQLTACPFSRCDGSGVIVTRQYTGAGNFDETETCECAKRGTAQPETVREWDCAGCQGCPSCCPGYIP